jgi:stress response protein YsnF
LALRAEIRGFRAMLEIDGSGARSGFFQQPSGLRWTGENVWLNFDKPRRSDCLRGFFFFFSRKKQMQQTLVGFYPTRSIANEVRTRLEAEGVNQSDINIGADFGESVHHETAETSKPASGFWAWLFGSDISDEQRERYAGHLRQGSIGVSVITRSDADRERAIEVMEHFDPIDIEGEDGRSVALQTSGPLASERDQVIPLAKEELAVGKREVERRYRVRTHVIERPVEAQVHLRDERVVIERRPAAATTEVPPESGFAESDVEVIERHEEPVVAKTSRASEEVVVHTEAKDRVETVRDRLRETKVDVEQSAVAPAAQTDQADVTDTAVVADAPRKT